MSFPPSHSFTITSNGGLLNVLRSDVHVSQSFDPRKRASGVVEPPFKKFVALWDTGATACVITEKVIQECDLKPIGMTEVHGVNGKHDTEIFLVNIAIPNKLAFSQIRVTRGILSPHFDVLIGMDIINTGDFAVTNHQNKTVFSFRVPSCEHIDFVKQTPGTQIGARLIPAIRPEPKVPRNSVCPCGSGKKYKRCCGTEGASPSP